LPQGGFGYNPPVSDASRAILHLDMDAFFAAVEQLDQPELRGKPILIGSARARGVVATASYEARPYGCHSAQPMAVALRLCPHAIVVPVRMSRYREVSHRVFEILESFSPLIEPLSIDEAFLDVSGSQRLHGSPSQIAAKLKTRIRNALQITASVGVSHNKFLAKLASDMNKPDGLTVIGPNDVDRILPPLPINRLWGVGPKTAARLEGFGVHTFGDIRRFSPERLTRLCGVDGEHLHRLAHGLDDRPVVPDSESKSIGQEETFEADVHDPDEIRRVLLGHVEHVAARLRRHALRAGGVTLKIRYGAFKTITRSTTLPAATDTTAELIAAAQSLFDGWAKSSFQPVRLIGITASRLTGQGGQMDLFIDTGREKQRRLDGTLDRINARFGSQSIRRGPS
jgi:DNA polymerase-4